MSFASRLENKVTPMEYGLERADFSRLLRVGVRVLLVIMLLLMPYATLTSDPGTPSGAAPFMHLAGMAWVAWLACMSFVTNRNRAWAVLLVFAYSALMELLQLYLPNRNATWEDVGINGLGCLLGCRCICICQSGQVDLLAEDRGRKR